MRKRGRPKKNAPTKEARGKRKVGRPRKNPISDKPKKTKIIKKTVKVVPAKKRKRGRPRKVDNPVEYSQKLLLPQVRTEEISKRSKSTGKSGTKSNQMRTQSRRKMPVMSESEGSR